MPHDIIDNRADKLVDAIRRVLPGAQAAKFAVGYFFLSGLEAVADHLYNVGELRLLIGNTSNRETIEQIAEGYRRLEQVRAAVEGLVRRLLDARGQGSQVSAWEAELNRWVYQVYGLSAEEIGVVEGEHHG